MIVHQYYAAIQTAVAIAERNTTPELMEAIRYDMAEIMEAYRTMYEPLFQMYTLIFFA